MLVWRPATSSAGLPEQITSGIINYPWELVGAINAFEVGGWNTIHLPATAHPRRPDLTLTTDTRSDHMAGHTGASRREAMRLRAQAEEAKARRNGRILWISMAAVAVAVLVILVLVITQTMGKDAPSAEQQTPPNATDGYGIEMTTQDVAPATDAPHLVIWEDSQCPICSQYEQTYGPVVKQLVDEGKITTEIRTAHFLDAQLRNDSSERAALAGASADAVGKFREFHDVLFTQQPEEGVGFTDQQLRVDFPTAAGIEGADLTKFQELYDGRAFSDFVDKANDQFTIDKIGGTPTYKVGDTKLEFFSGQEVVIQPTAEDMLRAITEANG